VQLARRTDKRRTFLRGVGTWALVMLGISALSPSQLGLALWAMGQGLAWSGYEAGRAAQGLAQPESVLVAYRVLLGPGAAGLLLLAMIVAWQYPISRQAHRELLDELAV